MKNRWIYAGAIAAMLAAAPMTARAQDATAPAPDATMPATPAPDATMPAPDPNATTGTMPAATTPDTMSTMPATPDASMGTTTPDASMGSATGGSMSMGTGMMAKPDFALLSDKSFDYVDLQKAKASGLSDDTIASLYILAKDTGYSFTGLTDKTLKGTTIATQAVEYGVPLATVLDTGDTKDKIAAYKAAYEQTGTYAVKNMMMSMPADSMTKPAMMDKPAMMAPKDIVATAMSDKRFSTLMKELKKADLVSTLQGEGPFTVFAPTNDAFKKLPKGALKKLEKDPAALKQVLTYHVIAGAKVDAATAMAMTSPTSPATVEGQTLQVTTADGKVKINDATVVVPDIQATNGIIHAIDMVLMPTDLPAMSPDAGSMAAPATDSTMPAPAAGTDTTTPTTDTTGGVGATPPAPAAPDTTAPAAPDTTAPATPAAPDATAPATGTDTTGTTGTPAK